jgi:thymidylate synthase ThyX
VGLFDGTAFISGNGRSLQHVIRTRLNRTANEFIERSAQCLIISTISSSKGVIARLDLAWVATE